MKEIEKKEIIVDFFKQILNVYEFELIMDKNNNSEDIFRLRDMQGGNLGNIQKDEFSTLADVIERLDVYHRDYIYQSLEDRLLENEIILKNDWELTAKRYIESDSILNILNQINVKEYNEIISKNQEFTTDDMAEILNEDEEFYKSVCKKYVDTMSKEMLLEVDNRILHFYIEDEYIKLSNSGKINDTNYKQFLDENYEVEEYNFYHELYYEIIKDNIAYDLNDLALFDENGKWDFYISFEELKRVGFAYMVKDQFSLIEKYAVPEEKIFDFFDYFTLEQLEDFEESLHLYFESKDIVYDENVGLYSREDNVFNSDIIRLACGLTTYEDFIKDYENYKPTYYDISLQKVKEYFKENGIKDLMDYGSDRDEGLYHLSSLYEEIMDNLNIKYNYIYTKDVSDGKYLTTIIFEDNSEIKLDTSAWNGIEVVAENVESVYATYDKLLEKTDEKDIEIEY